MNFYLFWHGESAEKVLSEFETNAEYGLSEKEAKTRLLKFGKNIFKHKEKFRFLKLLFRQIESPLILILIIAGLISVFLFRDYSDAAIIFAAVFLNTVIGIIQEEKVGADGRLLESRNLEINESALTGEWLANTKENKILPENTPLADRVNMIYAGTTVESG